MTGGCIANVDIDVDADGDGLLDSDEARLGSDPSNPDSDGDGWEDGPEADQYTDPTDASDHPYQNGWRIDACRNSIQSTGNTEGEIASNFALPDQFGETVKLYDFCNQVVEVIFAAFW